MPVLIQELVITTVIDANISKASQLDAINKPDAGVVPKEIIRQCVEQVLSILKEKQER
jgi:hypothetical protein